MFVSLANGEVIVYQREAGKLGVWGGWGKHFFVLFGFVFPSLLIYFQF